MLKYAETVSKLCGNGSNMRKYGEIKAAHSTSNYAKHSNIHIFQLENNSKYICKVGEYLVCPVDWDVYWAEPGIEKARFYSPKTK